jgi:hypothetical protein
MGAAGNFLLAARRLAEDCERPNGNVEFATGRAESGSDNSYSCANWKFGAVQAGERTFHSLLCL